MDKFDSKGCFIWDIDKGFVLTLDSNKCVESCWSGWASLSAAQIRQIYGDPPTFQKFQWPDKKVCLLENKAYWTFEGVLDVAKVAVVFQFGCIKKAGLVKHTHMDFAFDLLEVENR